MGMGDKQPTLLGVGRTHHLTIVCCSCVCRTVVRPLFYFFRVACLALSLLALSPQHCPERSYGRQPPFQPRPVPAEARSAAADAALAAAAGGAVPPPTPVAAPVVFVRGAEVAGGDGGAAADGEGGGGAGAGAADPVFLPPPAPPPPTPAPLPMRPKAARPAVFERYTREFGSRFLEVGGEKDRGGPRSILDKEEYHSLPL